MATLKQGSTGPDVAALQQQLQQAGFDPGAADGNFGPATAAAVAAFQRSVGLSDDGVVGPNTMAALNLPAINTNITLDMVGPMFPATPRVNIQFHLPFVLKALLDSTLADRSMVLMALATIRAEAASFLPIDERISIFNTTPGGPHPFDKYDFMAKLSNQGPPDGATFKGRGFVQLTGRDNYTRFSRRLGLGNQLVQNPDLANDPAIAAQLLAAFLGAEEDNIRQALQANDLATARKLVNGGEHGIIDFKDAYQRGLGLLPDPVQAQEG